MSGCVRKVCHVSLAAALLLLYIKHSFILALVVNYLSLDLLVKLSFVPGKIEAS